MKVKIYLVDRRLQGECYHFHLLNKTFYVFFSFYIIYCFIIKCFLVDYSAKYSLNEIIYYFCVAMKVIFDICLTAKKNQSCQHKKNKNTKFFRVSYSVVDFDLKNVLKHIKHDTYNGMGIG